MTRRDALVLFAGLPLLVWLQRADAEPVPAGDEVIPSAYRASAATHGVPAELLYAVACVESYTALGRYRARPWPWTLNVEGTAGRYPTRADAHDALVGHLRAGRHSIDVGLLQVNWLYHSARLGDTWLALEPLRNLDLGATILREQYDASGDWWLAAGRYHAIGAVLLVVESPSAEATAALQALAPNLRLALAPGDALVQTVGIEVYPVLLSARGIEQ